MKQAFKRILSVALVLLMVVVLLPAGVVTSAYALDDIQQTDDCTATVQAAAFPSVQPQADVSADAAATFSVDNTSYTDLNAAIDAAVKARKKIIVVATDGTLSGNYTIPAGVTLLVPFDDANTLYTTEPDAVESTANQTAYRTLTLNSGASITVNGAISVGGKLFTSRNQHVCKPTGAYGLIKMSSGSQITVANGGALYAWGYITGSGNVRITSGATVYECFQVTDWRGGSATIKFITPKNVKKVFPFSQYYVQNIEAPLTIEYGGAEKAYITAYDEKITIGFIGANSMFELAEGATFTKKYDPVTDRISFDINGNASLKGIKMTVILTIDSAKYVLPINNNVNINIHSGVTTISQDVALLPGVQVTIDQGAELNIQAKGNLYVYDADQWSKDYVWGSGNGISPVAYSPSGKGRRAVSDTAINVNGVLNAAGSVYTTTGGADIYSSQSTGNFVQTAVPGSEKNTYQCTQSGSKVTPVAIPITPAKLHNADGTYTDTAASNAGDTYVYANGKWVVKGSKIAINFDPNGGTGTMAAMSVNAGFDNTLPANAFTRADYTFTGWNTEANGSGTAYADGTTVNFNADTTLYAQWTQNPVITFDANGGTGTMAPVKTLYGEAYTLPACDFARVGYTFDGWLVTGTIAEFPNDDPFEVTEKPASELDLRRGTLFVYSNLTLKASWKVNTYTVTWKNDDGTVLKTTTVNYGEVPSYDGTPVKAETPYYSYEFTGWDKELTAVTGDVTYTAQFRPVGKNGLCIDGDATYWLENGQIVKDKGLTQVKDAQGHNLYYYFGADGKAVKNVLPDSGHDFWITKEKTNGLLPEWGYYFDENGVIPHDEQFQNGIVTEGDAKYYYIDGIRVHMGMFKLDGSYYYARSSGQLVTGREYYCERMGDSGLKEGLYAFDADGKLLLQKKGIVAENGSLYYYEYGVRTYAGLIEIDGRYYYVKTSGEVVHGRSYWITKTNGLMPERSYTFADDGKMIDPEFKDVSKSGIVAEDGSLYYYKDGLRTYAGLIEIDGSYYYVKTSGEVVHGRSYWISKTNGLMPERSYTFADDGTMLDPEIKDITKDGIVAENDSLYYYVDGLRTYAGLIKIGGSYYYVKTSGEVVHGRSYWITKTNGLMPERSYTFANDGKMIDPGK